MAISQQQRTDLLTLLVGMFDAAPGSDLLSALAEGLENGGTLEAYAANLVKSDEFVGIYSNALTSEEFATKFIANLLGSTVTAEITAAAEAYVAGRLNAGASRDVVIRDALTALAGVSEDDADFGAAVAQLNNKVEVAEYFGIQANYTGLTLSQMQSALDGVTSDDATVTAKKTAIDAGTLEGVGSDGQTFTLTTQVDAWTGGSGNDTFIADSASLSAADTIKGGTGTDKAEFYLDATDESVISEGVENFFLQATGAGRTFTMSNVTGAQQVWSNGSSTALTVSDLTSNATIGLKNTASNMSVQFRADVLGGSSAAINVAVDKVTGSTLTVDAQGSDVVKSLTIDTASKSSLVFAEAAAADTTLTSLTLTGAGKLTLTDAGTEFDSLTTIDASATTGGSSITMGGTTDLTYTGGAGDDVLNIGGDLDVNDKINGGDGTDTVIVSDATLSGTTTSVVKGANAMTSVEVLGTSVTAADGVSIKANDFTSINSFLVAATAALTPAAGTAADVAVTVTGLQNDDTIIVGNSVTGGTANAGSVAGADAINAQMAVNSGSDVFNLQFNAAATITGGAGFGTDMNGGDALDAATIETINISTASATADVSFVGGARTGTGTDGASFKVGANATVNITGAGDVNLGTVVAPSAETDDVTINGSAMTGALTVATENGNDVIKGGSGNDSITASTGINTITGNGGADTFNFANGDSTLTAMTTITDFTFGQNNDKFEFAGTAVYEKLTDANKDAIAADTSLTDAVTQAFTQLDANQATVFTYGSDSYVVYNSAGTNGAYDAANDVVVKLSGVTDFSAIDATQIA